jgi:hypothetical protein
MNVANKHGAKLRYHVRAIDYLNLRNSHCPVLKIPSFSSQYFHFSISCRTVPSTKMPHSHHDHLESPSKSSNHTPTQNIIPRQEVVETAQVDGMPSLRTSADPDMRPDYHSASKTTMIAQLPQSDLQFEHGDVGNPRNWSTRKKCGVGCFVLFAAFVASVPITPHHIIPKSFNCILY